MKKLTIVLGVFIFIALFSFIFMNKTIESMGDFEVEEYVIEGKKLRLLVADTPEKHERGLMYFRKLDGAAGMIFLFPESKDRIFWNKNTFLNLDVIWQKGERSVGHDFLPSIETSREIVQVDSPEPVNRVVELVR